MAKVLPEGPQTSSAGKAGGVYHRSVQTANKRCYGHRKDRRGLCQASASHSPAS